MSDKKKKAEEAGEGKKKSKKKLIIMIVAVLAVGGGVYKFMLAPKPKPAPPAPGDVVKMDPTIVNLSDGHYLKVGLNIVLVSGKATADKFDDSEAGQDLIDTFTNLNRATLTNAQRKKLQAGLAQQIKTTKDYKGMVYSVYFNNFLID